ncbi:MAG: hypothetical protein U1E17_12450 [Geminicoccaceae bacterium]
MIRPATRALALLTLLLLPACAGSRASTADADLFCYQWLTDVLCYAEPFPDSAARLLGRPRVPADAS